jgi:hypothetical protein
VRIAKTALVGGSASGLHLSWMHHTLHVSRRGIRYCTVSIPWSAVQSFKVDASPGETRWFLRRYRETNITVRTNMGTYRFISVARVPIQRVRGIFEYCSGRAS